MQDRKLPSARKSCRKGTMEKKQFLSISVSDPILLKGLFLQQALARGVFQALEGSITAHPILISPGLEIGLKTLHRQLHSGFYLSERQY